MTEPDMKDWDTPDWSRETPHKFWDPSRQLLRTIRAYQATSPTGLGKLRRKWLVLQHRFWSCVTQAEIDLHAKIGGRLLLPHPNGVVIHRRAEVGPNCLLFQQVTLGLVAGEHRAPRLGVHVDVGAGARILGAVTIGDHAVIGANAVVLCDVPAHATAVGVPARIITGKDKP